ncbi:MAG TPA: pitrilysin family protein [Steroidobacteraceae bacterium]|jgi:predicted Zn-dependent peptidase|nr:pitrilysin family protein [Steroidobacteraceae bacterium]
MKSVRAALLFICFTVFTTGVLAAGNGVKVPPFERVQLGNGAVVLLMERHDVPLIAFSAVLRGGAVSDPAGESGMASLLVGLLEKGSGTRDAVAFAETVASVGGQVETSASTESIAVSGSFLARDQQLMVELLADMLQRPRLELAQFDTLRARQIEFIRAAKESDLAALAPIYGEASLFAAHPYGRPVDGSEASLAAIKHAELQRYYQEQVGADRLILAVAGDFKTAQLKQRISRAFSGWRKASAPLPQVPKAQSVATRRVLLIDAPESVQSYFWAGNVAVAKSDPRRAALDVTNTLFGGRFTSMLNSELRIRTGLSYSAGSHFDRLLQPGHWALTSFTQTETTIQALDLALATLDKLHASGLDAKALDSGKSYVQGQFPLALETSAQWASQLATLEFYGLSRSYIDDYSAALAGVSATDAKRVIDEVLPSSSQLAIVVVGNAGALRDGLRKYGPVTEMKLADPSFAPVRTE